MYRHVRRARSTRVRWRRRLQCRRRQLAIDRAGRAGGCGSAARCLPASADARRHESTNAEKLRRRAARRYESLARVKLQSPAGEISLDPQSPIHQVRGVVGEQREVVNVADVRRPQNLGHEMIEAVEIEIGEELAGQIADRQTAAAPERLEQIVALEMQIHRLLRVRAIDNQVQQGKRRRATDAAAEVRFQHRVVDRREIAIDVAAQNTGVAVAIELKGVDRAVRSLADSGWRTCGR